MPWRAVADPDWAAWLRRYGRAAVWSVPAAAILLTLAGLWGWPRPDADQFGQSPGTWLVVTALGMALALVGAYALAALLVPTPGGRWAALGAVVATGGSLLIAPVLGLVALARPAAARSAAQIGAEAAADLERRFFDSVAARGLVIVAVTLLALGWMALGLGILSSGILSRFDGRLLLGAVGLFCAGAALGWQFLLVLGSMTLLAAGLGVACTAVRFVPEAHPGPAE